MRIVSKILKIVIGMYLLITLTGCGISRDGTSSGDSAKLKVVATTTFVGDTVKTIAGDAIDLTVLLKPGQNPHAYEVTPQDLVKVSEADLVFANGLGLEEFLDDLMTGSENQDALVIVSENISPLDGEEHHDHEGEGAHEDGEEHHDDDHEGDDHDEGEEHHDDYHEGEDHEEGEEHHDEDHEGEEGHDHGGLDPHVWFDPDSIILWVEVISEQLAEADPENTELYLQNAENYQSDLEELDSWIQDQISVIPEDNLELVTDHTSFTYFVEAYGLEQIGAVIPASTTEVETSGQELAALIETIRDHDVQAIFVGIDIDPSLAEQVAEETGVELVPLYVGSLSDGDPAGTYLDFMRYNVEKIVNALK